MRKNIIGVKVKDYYPELVSTIQKISPKQLDEVENVLRKAREDNKTVYLMGNGGSASTAEHMCNDLMKIGNMKAKSLTNISVITAYANDLSYGRIFVEQLKWENISKGDIVIGISGSGNSPNIIKALAYAKAHGATTIAFLGFDGGRAKDMVDHYVWIHSRNYGIVEDLHLSLGHCFAMRLANNG